MVQRRTRMANTLLLHARKAGQQSIHGASHEQYRCYYGSVPRSCSRFQAQAGKRAMPAENAVLLSDKHAYGEHCKLFSAHRRPRNAAGCGEPFQRGTN